MPRWWTSGVTATRCPAFPALPASVESGLQHLPQIAPIFPGVPVESWTVHVHGRCHAQARPAAQPWQILRSEIADSAIPRLLDPPIPRFPDPPIQIPRYPISNPPISRFKIPDSRFQIPDSPPFLPTHVVMARWPWTIVVLSGSRSTPCRAVRAMSSRSVVRYRSEPSGRMARPSPRSRI